MTDGAHCRRAGGEREDHDWPRGDFGPRRAGFVFVDGQGVATMRLPIAPEAEHRRLKRLNRSRWRCALVHRRPRGPQNDSASEIDVSRRQRGGALRIHRGYRTNWSATPVISTPRGQFSPDRQLATAAGAHLARDAARTCLLRAGAVQLARATRARESRVRICDEATPARFGVHL